MFERFTEQARRSIFFARYEASQFGSPEIETVHLLLGLARESPVFLQRLSEAGESIESLRARIEKKRPVAAKIATSLDIPLSRGCKTALERATAEAGALNDREIDIRHLVLGLLRLPESLACTLLGELGITYENFLEYLSVSSGPSSTAEEPLAEDVRTQVAAPSLTTVHYSLNRLLEHMLDRMDRYSEEYGRRRLKRKPWSRKEAAGHLVDLASAHHQWIGRALTESSISVSGYPQDDRVSAQRYDDVLWSEPIDLWASLSLLVLHVIAVIPEDKVNTPVRVGLDQPIPLHELLRRYNERCEDFGMQIASRL